MKKKKISIIGLGYVGLPLSVEFSKKHSVIGFDKSLERIKQLKNNIDINNEINLKNNTKSKNLIFTNEINDLKKSEIFIVTVPTPIKKNKKPNLSFLSEACKIIAKVINKKNIVIFESTVYPGLTEEFCIPIIEKNSNLKLNKDFFCGYSPERINPGDDTYTLTNIIKIVSGSNKKTTNSINKLYLSIIKAGTYVAPSIRVAEAAKVIENSQRDLNIAFVNELSIIFNKLNLNTIDILKAASTKWNFSLFKPGLVGGHCIGVDPYYLTYKSKKIGYKPKVILAGRKINDNMSNYIVKKIIEKLKLKKINTSKAKLLILGFTFKENCSDIRNSKIEDIYNLLKKRKYIVDIFDPFINKPYKKINFVYKPKKNYYDAIILAVPHDYFIKMGLKKINSYGKKNKVFFDIKNVFSNEFSDFKL